MATSVTEPVTRTEIVRRTYPGERDLEYVRPTAVSGGGALFGRLLICQIFIASGISKILDWAGTQGHMTKEFRGFFDSAGTSAEVTNFFLSAIPFMLGIAILVELGAGLGVLLGCKTRLSALALFAFLIPTTLIFHSFWRFPEAEQQLQMIMFMKNLTIMGGLALLMSFGPGRISMDARKRRVVEVTEIE